MLLNVGAGFNTDTGQIVDLDFTNHLFLDVKALGYLGVINQADGHFATNFNVSGNSLRICGRTAAPSYRDFEFVPNNGRLSNPLRVLGGLLTNYASGLVIQGAAREIRFADNWFTTRPLSGFYVPNPANTVEAKFRPLWKPGASDPYAYDPSSTFFPYVDPAADVVLLNNSASTVSFDFTARVNFTDAGTYTSFANGTAPGQTGLRDALASTPNFSPTGMVERVTFVLTNRSITFSWLASTSTPANPVYRTLTANQNTLYGAYEVALGTPVVVNATTINVPVRLALQPTPSSGLSGTVPQNNQTVWLQTGTGTPVSLLTGADGLAWFPVTLTSGANSLLTFRAWRDAGVGSAGVLDEYQDAWATAQWTQNAVVWVKASPDVANDQTLARGRFHFYRTGSAAQLATTQLVNFSLPVTPLATYPSPATYGSTGNGDYFFAASTNNVPSAWTVGGGSGTVTFAANQTEALLDVVPRKDTKLETNVVYLTVTAGTGYAVPAAGNIISPPSAAVLIYDGPEFALYELGDYTPVLSGYPGYGGSPRSPDATGAYALDNNATPKIAGGASYLAGYSGPDQLFGGWWTSAVTTTIRDYYNDRVLYYPGWGAATLGVSDDGIFVGQKGNNAFKFTTAANSAVNLPHLSANGVRLALL